MVMPRAAAGMSATMYNQSEPDYDTRTRPGRSSPRCVRDDDRPEGEGMMHEPEQPRWSIVLAAMTLLYLVSAVFWPMVRFEFVQYDARQQLLENPGVQRMTVENLKHIFTSRCVTSYYPVRTLTYALDYQLWGLHAGGFKLTNGLIHWANVLLVFWLVLRLFRHPCSADRSPGWWDVCVATFSAGVFAVHPVVVEPVVWVPGREELLMTLGALGCIHFHLTGRRLSERGGRARAAVACYASAAFCCAAACLSNAVAAVIPPLIVTWDLLTLVSPKLRRILYATSALWVIGAVTIVIKWLGPEHEHVANQVGPFSIERLGLVLNVYWLNLKTLVWPTQLAIEYPGISHRGFLDAEVVLGGIAVGVTCAVLWLFRRYRLILFGLVWFCLALGPASQIMPHHIHRADRFLYLPFVGLVVAAAMGLRSLAGTLKRRRLPAGVLAAAGVLGLVVLLVLDTFSAHQVQTWRDERAMWEQCLKVDPNSARAHGGLADQLANAGQFEEATRHYRAVVRIDPHDPEKLDIVALQLASFKDERFRDYDEAIRIARRACELSGWVDPRYIRGLATVYTLFAHSLADRGDFGAAIRNYGNAVKVAPEFVPALRGLAVLLAACPQQELRDYESALGLVERAFELTERADPTLVMVIAGIHAQAGRREMAIASTEEAVALAQAAGDVELADELRHRLQLYRNGVSPEAAGP